MEGVSGALLLKGAAGGRGHCEKADFGLASSCLYRQEAWHDGEKLQTFSPLSLLWEVLTVEGALLLVRCWFRCVLFFAIV